ncbi:MAG: LysR family transcriptional regulator [Arenicella sp.]
MDWNSLKVFLAIARSGSLSGAANNLAVNHSTIFRRLNAFEDEIGGRLFERLNNRYELTSMGHEVLDLAQDIENSFDTMERHIVGKDFRPKGTVKITAPNNIAYAYLPRYLADFKELHPDILVELLVSNQAFNMSNRQADIAVRATSAPPEHLVGRQVCSINWSVYACAAYAEKRGLPQTFDDLNNHLLISATGNIASLPAFVMLEKHFSEQVVTRCDELVSISHFVESGQGLAFLPDDQLRPGIQKLFTLDMVKTSDLWLLTHPDLRNVERVKLVMQHLAESFEQETDF